MSTRRGQHRERGDAPAANENVNVAIPEQPQPDLSVIYKKITNLGGQTFQGKESVVEAQAWIRTCERIFKGLQLVDDQKRYMASWLLKSEALVWWETMTQEEAEENFTWDRFKQVFEDRYVPAEGVARLYQEFS